MATKKNQKVEAKVEAPIVAKVEEKKETKIEKTSKSNSFDTTKVVKILETITEPKIRVKDSTLWVSVFAENGEKVLQVLKSKRNFHFQTFKPGFVFEKSEARSFTDNERKEFHATRVFGDFKISNESEIKNFLTSYFKFYFTKTEEKAKKNTKKEKKTA